VVLCISGRNHIVTKTEKWLLRQIAGGMGGRDCAGNYRGYQEARMYRKCAREESW